MHENVKHTIHGDTLTVEMLTSRFTHELVTAIKTEYPLQTLATYKVVEFNLDKVKMIDSSSIGFLFDLHNKLKTNNEGSKLVISVGKNQDLRDLLHKFQADLLLNVK